MRRAAGARAIIGAALKEFPEERRRLVRDTDNLVRRLAVKFEVEFGLGPAVSPVVERLESAAPQRPLHARRAPDGDAHARRLPGDAALLRNRLSARHDAARDEALPAL